MSTRKKPKPLTKRLWAANLLLRDWRRAVKGSAPDEGSKEAEENELAKFDAACAAINEAIRVLKASGKE